MSISLQSGGGGRRRRHRRRHRRRPKPPTRTRNPPFHNCKKRKSCDGASTSSSHMLLPPVEVIEEPIGELRRYPTGVKFSPTDDEIIEHLMNKVRGEPVQCDVIKPVNLYMYHPAALVEIYKEIGKNFWYFLTPRFRKYAEGDLPNRSADGGYWKVTRAGQAILGKSDKKEIGYKSSLIFVEGKYPGGRKTKWLMHEYMIPESHMPANNQNLLDTWIIVKVYKDGYIVDDDSSCECEAAPLPSPTDELNGDRMKCPNLEPDMPTLSQARSRPSLEDISHLDQQFSQLMHPSMSQHRASSHSGDNQINGWSQSISMASGKEEIMNDSSFVRPHSLNQIVHKRPRLVVSSSCVQEKEAGSMDSIEEFGGGMMDWDA